MHHTASFATAALISVPNLALAQNNDGKNPNGGNNNGNMNVAAAVTPAIPQVPQNTPAGRFGGKGQLAISSDAGLSISNSSQSGRGGSTTTLQMRPAVDYFVIDHLSIGGFLGLNYEHVPTGHSTTWSLGPRVGYDIPLSGLFSIWPKAGLSFSTVAQTVSATSLAPQTSSDSSNLTVNLFVPVMLHPATHFFLGFGPALDADVSGSVKTTTVAGRLTIGGWI